MSETIGTNFINREGVSVLPGRRGPLQAATTAKTVDSNVTNVHRITSFNLFEGDLNCLAVSEVKKPGASNSIRLPNVLF